MFDENAEYEKKIYSEKDKAKRQKTFELVASLKGLERQRHYFIAIVAQRRLTPVERERMDIVQARIIGTMMELDERKAQQPQGEEA